MTGQLFIIALFWGSVAGVLFIFAGYPVLLRCLALWRHKINVEPPPPSSLPRVTCLIVAYNEAARITGRIGNLLNCDYPKELLDVIVVSDGSTDETDILVETEARKSYRVSLIRQPRRQGKAAGLNTGLARAQGDIVVFADARQSFDAGAISALVRNFKNPRVGAVSGNYSMNPAESTVGKGVDSYWKLEKIIRESESRIDSVIGCTGAIYAVRKELCPVIPPDTLLDDVVIPMEIAMKGYRVLFEPEALAFDPQPVQAGRETLRKTRTLAGNFQMLFRYPNWILPWTSRLWWQVICHKYARLAAPVFLAIQFAANLALIREPFYACLFVGQAAFYLCALLGLLFPGANFRALTIPAGFVFLNSMTLAGFWYYLFRNPDAGWETSSSPDPQDLGRPDE